MINFLNGINDLTNTHYLYRILVRRELLENHTLLLINPLIFGGRPLSGDSLSDIFYPPFYLHVFLPFSLATIINLIVHFVISYFGVYLIARHILKAKKNVAVVSGIIYVFFPKIFYHITAGHLGMIESLSWLPLIFYFVLKASRDNYHTSRRDIFLFSVCCGLSALANYFIFYYVAVFLFLFWVLEMLLTRSRQTLFLSVKFFFFSTVLFFLIAGIQIIPAILQFPNLVREGIAAKDLIPFWSWRYLLQSIFSPFRTLQKYEQEAFIYAGITFYLVSFWGMWKLRVKNKGVYLGLLFLLFNIVMNLKSPLFFLLQRVIPGGFSWRVTTRFWFFIQLILTMFFVKTMDLLPKKIFYIIAGLILLEFIIIDAIRLMAPNPFGNQKDAKIYSYLKTNYFGRKVYTTSALLSQYYTARYGIELVAGESPWQNRDYIKKLKAAGGYAWFNEYAVIYPPWQAVEKQAQPVSELLCDLKGEVVLSVYPLADKNFKYVKEIDKIKVYENKCKI